MHELSIIEEILKITQNEARKHNAKRILEIRLMVGEMSGVIPDIMQEYFNIASKGTLAEGALLKIKKVPIKIKCQNCCKESIIKRNKVKCPLCGSYDIKIISGREFYIDSLEVE
ncbi:hydrogenase maturation nickel metallochaperone HypA [Caloramator sp. E03]|uniref:hydrogenase maturation nickel metallochaperone HypA n=1 Tax=Caloramator sp. E03 TaxID=2576307 RepID=UPI00111063B0|nr:hydrogenase maturation nickel metallochaperone HypA [Caloramator sp. E03]QCX32607.1 hydrogenase maturation nickel metallochaperone HypA [Caloramator sp. E03]